MQPKFKRLIFGASALAVAAGGLLVTNNPAQAALPPYPAADGTVTIAATQLLTTTLSMAPNTAPGICDGNSSTGGYRWQTFITGINTDPGALTYNASGPVAPAGSVGFTSGLLDISGNFVIQKNTSAAATITPIPGFSLSSLVPAGLVPGQYNIGFACSLAGATTNFWTAPITVTATNYSVGIAPPPPVLTGSSYDAGTATVNFTHAGSDPATTGYIATVTPVGGAPAIAPVNVPAGETSFQLPVALGDEYDVTLVAVNSVGASPIGYSASPPAGPDTPLRVIGAETRQTVVNPIASIFEGADITISWAALSPAPTNFTVAVTGGPTTVAPITETGTSTAVSGLAAGDYSVVVTPNYPSGSGITGVASVASFTFAVQFNTLIYQEITVTRPPGALVLTQRCGVYGPLNEFTAADTFPGFPRTLAAAAAVASTPGVNEAPDVDVAPDATYTADPNFPNYPEVGTYPTECGLSMGTARFVTSGALAGQFYTAEGRLNQVTVLDTRDVDAGWTARGDIEDSFGSGGDTFSGNYLGWAPQVTDTSDPSVGSPYDQVVNPGGVVLPGAGTPGNGTGLTSNPPLAFAAAGAGLGIATLDARMNLLIPASADAGNYSATLSLTVA